MSGWALPPGTGILPAAVAINGLSASTLEDPATSGSGVPLASGSIYALKTPVYIPGPVNNLGYNVSAAEVAGTAGQNLMGVYTLDGQTQLGVTGDLSTGIAGNWTAAGTKTTPLVALLPAAAYVWILVLAVAVTTQPSLRAAGAASGGANIGPSATTRCTILSTGQTALPANFAPPTAVLNTPLPLMIGLW